MTPAQLPQNESERIDALQRYEIPDPGPQQKFDDLTLLASHICQSPIALISLVDAERQWFKSGVGLTTSQTPRSISFCGHAILEDDVMVVPDAAADARFSDNPLVTGEPNVRFYAGAPLVTPEGQALGTLCVLDRVPRELTSAQLDALRALARQVVAQLELRRRLQREREQAREALDGRGTAVHLILNQMPAILWSTDTDLRLTSSAGAALAAAGRREGASVGLTLSEFFHTTDPEFLPLVAHRKALLGE